MILVLQAGFRNLDASFDQSRGWKPDITQFIVDSYIHVHFEGIVKHDFGLGEKTLVERGRKMVKNGENGSEIE